MAQRTEQLKRDALLLAATWVFLRAALARASWVGLALVLTTACSEGSLAPRPRPPVATAALSRSEPHSEEAPASPTEMVDLPAGSFVMGSKHGDEDELPELRLRVLAFALDRHEVTVAAYAACVAAGSCAEPRTGGYCNWHRTGRDAHPINCLNWHAAQRYCQWRQARLPTEAEWEYAARSAGQTSAYPWGNAAADCTRAVMAEHDQDGCGQDGTWPVCSKSQGNSAQGLCDLAGNVWEWVDADYCYYGTTRCTPGQRVGRGGSWTTRAAHALRATNRNADDDRFNDNNLGFRCARSPHERK